MPSPCGMLQSRMWTNGDTATSLDPWRSAVSAVAVLCAIPSALQYGRHGYRHLEWPPCEGNAVTSPAIVITWLIDVIKRLSDVTGAVVIDKFPVTSLKHTAIVLYCAWRTARYTAGRIYVASTDDCCTLYNCNWCVQLFQITQRWVRLVAIWTAVKNGRPSHV